MDRSKGAEPRGRMCGCVPSPQRREAARSEQARRDTYKRSSRCEQRGWTAANHHTISEEHLMDDKNPNIPQDKAGDQKGYTPASPVKRAMAWIGIVYMVIIVALTTYIYATGAPLKNLAPLLAIPALVGLGVVALISARTTGKPGKPAAIALAVLCWAAALYSIPLGLAGLLSNFGG